MKINTLQLQEDIYKSFREQGILLKSDHYSHYDNIEDLENYLSKEFEYLSDSIGYIFTNGGCFMYSRLLNTYLEEQNYNTGIVLLMENFKDMAGNTYIDIDHSIIYDGFNYYDILGNITEDINNNNKLLNTELYHNLIYSHGEIENIDNNLISEEKHIQDMSDLEWLYESGDLCEYESQIKEILFPLFKKHIII